jgi:hypothetical protein
MCTVCGKMVLDYSDLCSAIGLVTVGQWSVASDVFALSLAIEHMWYIYIYIYDSYIVSVV